MSIRQRGKKWELKVTGGSETIGHDV